MLVFEQKHSSEHLIPLSPIIEQAGSPNDVAMDSIAGGEDGKGTLTLRSLVSTKEAGIIIGPYHPPRQMLLIR